MSQLINLMVTGANPVPRAYATEAIRAVTKAVRQSLQAGVPVFLEGVGRLYVKQCDARKGHNPRTGEPIEIPAKRRVRFKQAPSLEL